MSFASKFFIAGTVLALYGLSVFFYFSEGPQSRYSCPVEIPGVEPLALDDQSDRNHQFESINDVSCLSKQLRTKVRSL